MMGFSQHNRLNFLDTSAYHYNRRYASSGYELDKSQPPFSDGAPIFDPILFFSQNSHLICSGNDRRLNNNVAQAFRYRNNESPILLVFPDFPGINLKGCTRVKLMKRRDLTSTDATQAEFVPTGSYSLRQQRTPHGYFKEPKQPTPYLDKPPSAGDYLGDVTQSHMYLTVVCQADDRCPCHGCVIRINTVRKFIRNSLFVLTIYRMEISRCSKETKIHHS
jgi:hypothetical protein